MHSTVNLQHNLMISWHHQRDIAMDNIQSCTWPACEMSVTPAAIRN